MRSRYWEHQRPKKPKIIRFSRKEWLYLMVAGNVHQSLDALFGRQKRTKFRFTA